MWDNSMPGDNFIVFLFFFIPLKRTENVSSGFFCFLSPSLNSFETKFFEFFVEYFKARKMLPVKAFREKEVTEKILRIFSTLEVEI